MKFEQESGEVTQHLSVMQNATQRSAEDLIASVQVLRCEWLAELSEECCEIMQLSWNYAAVQKEIHRTRFLAANISLSSISLSTEITPSR